MRRRAVFAATVLLALLLSACVTQQSSGSRSELYGSVAALAADSTLVVVAEVLDQRVVDDQTQSTVVVAESFSPEGLGREVPEGTAPVDGNRLVVRQMNVAGIPSLSPGGQYLLFLTPTKLDGNAADDFYITGASAGVYAVTGDTFTHGPFEEGDTLPATLTRGDLEG